MAWNQHPPLVCNTVGFQPSLEYLQIYTSVSENMSSYFNSKWKILRFLDVTPQENELLTLPDESILISHTSVKNYMKTFSLVVIIKYFIGFYIHLRLQIKKGKERNRHQLKLSQRNTNLHFPSWKRGWDNYCLSGFRIIDC